MSFWRVFRLILCMVALIFPGAAMAQTWPERAVTFVVPYPPGAGADIVSRALADRLSKMWGQPVLVENKPGAVENIAAGYVARAKPDGYTILFASEAALQANEFLFKHLTYNPRSDFQPITRIVQGYLVYVVRDDSRFKSIQDIVDEAKTKPGTIAYGSSGAGSSVHLTINWLASQAGIKLKHVPYQGAAPRLQAMLTGEIDFTVAPLAAVAEMIKAKQLRALATTSETRMTALPEIPTLTELGFKDSVIPNMFALVGPVGLKPEIADKITAGVKAVLAEPEFQSRYVERLGYVAIGDGPADFAKFLEQDRDHQKARVDAAGVTLD